jgi:Capsule polysaccharide biosynthesis protein
MAFAGATKEFLKRQTWFRPVRLARLAWQARRDRPDWSRLLSAPERAGLAPSQDAPRVLIGTSVGLHLAVNAADSLFAAGLLARGAKVDVLLCDAAVPACLACDYNWFPDLDRFLSQGARDLCKSCFAPAERMFADLPVTLRRYSNFLTEEDRAWARSLAQSTSSEKISGLTEEGMAVGEHALAGALRFFARGDLATEPLGLAVTRKYLESSLLIARAARRLFREHKYAAAVLHHGIYVPQGLLAEAAQAEQTRVVAWNLAYRKRSFIFCHGETYHRALMNEPTDTWAAMPWSPAIDARLRSYLGSRAGGTNDWISFYREPEEDFARIAAELGIDAKKPIVLMLTNVVWDAQLHYPGNAFPTMIDWIVATVEYMAGRPDLQLVIRVHPAEVTGALPSRQRVADELRRRFPELPANVIVVPPEHPASSYVIASQSNVALVYASRMGVELAALGLPVIVAGEAWVRNKGITSDARDRVHYLELLAQLPLSGRLNAEQAARARKYAFHFFFRRMIPVGLFAPESGWPYLRVEVGGVDGLKAGADPGLDVICEGILEGKPFVYPAEREDAAT